MSNRFRAYGTGSTSYGQFWFGGNSFPGFLYKKNVGVGGRRSTRMIPGGSTITNTYQDVNNSYIPGSGVGSSNIAVRRAKMIHSTTCINNGQPCGRFYPQLGQNQLAVSPYSNPN